MHTLFISQRKALFTYLMLVLVLISSSSFAQTIKRIDGTGIKAEELTARIETLRQAAKVTGVAVSVFNNNEVVYQQALGYRNAETKDPLKTGHIFYGASLSKAVFAHIVMQLVEAGTIDLDTPLQNYLDKPLPEIKFAKSWRGYHDLKNDKRYEKLTARMCLSHTTGFPNWRFITKNGYDRNGKLYFQFEPGSRYSYSGEGIYLLQFVIEQITGRGLEAIAQELVFQPLGMDQSSYLYIWDKGMEEQYVYGHDKNQKRFPIDEVDEAGGAGSLETTLEDYSKFMTAVMKQELLSKSLYKEMFSKQIRIKSKQNFGPNAWVETDEYDDIALSYGLGWEVIQTPYGMGAFKAGHSEGYQHYSIIFPQQKTGVLIMTNSDKGESIFKELLELTIGDVYTPWKWQNYIPYDQEV